MDNQSSVDEFFVDDFLDLSNGFGEDEIEKLEEQPNGIHSQKTCSSSPQKLLEKMEAAENEDFGSFPGSELNFQEIGLDSLEWLSQFVEDNSCVGYSLIGKLPETENSIQIKPCFTTPVQTKARTKRARTGGRVWSLRSVTLTGSSTSSGSSSFSSTTTTTTAESINRLSPPFKQRKTRVEKSVQPRRCSHCGVQKTPQWRTGPMGAKTLCNACGVRFKSGRLLPEYRPACSPTFSSERHSNNHRKVLEMRQKKAGLALPVQRF
ncbi:GATA transcription factor 5 [Capsicum baccatum]|uniref:GATA transcription factor n=1 Tax=Capsicum baccatum TaxID=33114 RepID=A0A2G2WWX5_CAPBA|nr:GATA transcription factor 5 [Capsicum baccatum]